MLGVALVSLAALSADVFAFPLEKFEHQLEVTCAADPSCSRSARAKTTLGAYIGMWVRGGADTHSTLSISKGTLRVHMRGSLLSGVQLSWDSDTYADQLSSSGLTCVDMRHQGGSAIVLKDFKLKGTCGDDDVERECAPFVIETRIYDSADPTGQTYSASVLRRGNGKEPQDLIIPFSNFNRKGLRGEGRLDCAGAVSINIRTDGYRDVTLSVGSIFTNSSEPFEALILTPTPTPVHPTPTISGNVSDTATRAPTSAPAVGATETTVSTPKLVGNSGQNEPVGVNPEAASVSEVVIAPLNPPKPHREEEEDTVYGSIVSE